MEPKNKTCCALAHGGEVRRRDLLCLAASAAALANDAAIPVAGLALVTHPLAVGGLRESSVALGEGDGDSLAEHF